MKTFNVGHAVELTDASLETFEKYARDAGNWSGNPWVSDGNVTCTKAMRGNLSDLVQKGLIRVCNDGNNYAAGCSGQYVEFTAAGRNLAEQLGISLE